jgi:hypothetical protein
MIQEEIIFYLKSHLGRFRIPELKAQLLSEGVSEEEFKEALKAAKRAKNRKLLGRFVMASGALALFAALLFFLSQKSDQNPEPSPSQAVFVSSLGYVVHIPEGYTAIKTASSKDRETVYFCKKGADPSTFLDEGLYGELGIVQLTVAPRPFPQGAGAFSKLERLVLSRAKTDRSPFHTANTQISEMNGLEVSFEAPTPRILSYVLGGRNLYIFLAGINDPIYPSILHSLRETQ